MDRSEHLDFEIVKKRARELISIKKTVIKLDGPIYESNLEYDQFRDAEMVNLGLHISSFALLCSISCSRTEKFLNI
jgi:very-short-patch-repair endonuclease